MTWLALHPELTPEHLGFLPEIFLPEDRRKATDQANERYVSGWEPQDGWVVNIRTGEAQYPGDPAVMPVAATIQNAETILLYPSSYVCIIQPDGSYEMARMD